MRRVKLLCSLIMLLASQGAQAVSYPLPPEGSRLVGSTLTITVPPGNTKPLEAFAAQYGQGLSNMLEANPGVDVFLPKSGSTLVVPQQLILPDTVREGIVINVAEMRLYYYPAGSNTVEVLPIGIGQAGRETPRSQGCIRLRNDDIKYLFDTVPVGTRVQLIDRPVKYSEEPDGSRWVEVHEPLSRNRSEYESDRKVPLPVTPALRTFISGNDVDVSRGSQALERRSGMPVNISLVQKHY